MTIIRIKRGLKANLPVEAKLGELLGTTDTGELFMGMGEGEPLKQLGGSGGGSTTVAVITPVRQTVLTGRVDSNGYANFLEAGTGFTIDLKAFSTPVEIAFAAGFHKGALDYVERIESDVNAAWTLPPNKRSFLYIDRDPNTGALSYGHTPFLPEYAPSLAPAEYTPNLVPLMPSSNTAEGVTVSADSSLNGGNSVYRAFDNDDSTYWHSHRNFPHWLKVDFGAARQEVVIRYFVSFRHDLRANTWAFQGSNNNSTWDTIHTVTGANVGDSGAFFDCPHNNTAYRYYRLYITSGYPNTHGDYIAIRQFELYAGVVYVTGKHWFNTSDFKMRVLDGESWVEKQRVFVGEAVTNESSVTSVITYALQGRYDSGWFPVVANTLYNKSHNIGLPPQGKIIIKARKSDGSGPVVDALVGYTFNGSVYHGANLKNLEDRNAISVLTMSNAYHDPMVVAAGSAQYRVIVERGW